MHLPYKAQRAKKVVSDSPGLVDFAIGLVNSVINLPDGQVKFFFEEFKSQNNCEINLLIKTFLGLVEMMFGLVNVSFSLPEWKTVKMTFFEPWNLSHAWAEIRNKWIRGNFKKKRHFSQKYYLTESLLTRSSWSELTHLLNYKCSKNRPI